MLKFYDLGFSPFATRCRIQIYAKNLQIPMEAMKLPLPESFVKRNPLKRLPALDIDGFLLPESEVICEYLEDLAQGPSLRPADLKDRAHMRLLSRTLDLYVMTCVGKLVPFLRGAPRDEAVIAAAVADLEKALRDLVHFGIGRHYAVGGKLTLADCALMPGLLAVRGVTGALKLADPLPKVPAINAYFDATGKDPHVARGIGEMSEALKTM
jgi:glutathione S-transferase